MLFFLFFGWSVLLQILRKQAAFSFAVLCVIMFTPCPLQREICITTFSSLHCFAICVFGFLFEKIRKPCKLKIRQSSTKHLISHLFLMTQFFGRGVMLTAVAKIRSSDAVEWNFDLAQPRPLAFTFNLREGPEDDAGRWGYMKSRLWSHSLPKRIDEASPRLFRIHESMTTPIMKHSQHFDQQIRNSRWFVLRVARRCCF